MGGAKSSKSGGFLRPKEVSRWGKEEPGIGGRNLDSGEQSINGRFQEAVGGREYHQGVSGQENGQQEGTDQ